MALAERTPKNGRRKGGDDRVGCVKLEMALQLCEGRACGPSGG